MRYENPSRIISGSQIQAEKMQIGFKTKFVNICVEDRFGTAYRTNLLENIKDGWKGSRSNSKLHTSREMGFLVNGLPTVAALYFQIL